MPNSNNAFRAIANHMAVHHPSPFLNTLNTQILRTQLASINKRTRALMPNRGQVSNVTKARGILRKITVDSRHVLALITILKAAKLVAKKSEERHGNHLLSNRTLSNVNLRAKKEFANLLSNRTTRFSYATTVSQLVVHTRVLGYHLAVSVSYTDNVPTGLHAELTDTPQPIPHENPIASFGESKWYTREGLTMDQRKALKIAVVACLEFTQIIPTWLPGMMKTSLNKLLFKTN